MLSNDYIILGSLSDREVEVFLDLKSTVALLQSLAGRKPTPPTLRYQSFLFPQFSTSPIKSRQIKLPKIGLVDINLHREIPEGFKVKGVRVVSRCRGTKWFVVITIQADVSVPETHQFGRAIGVDLGLIDLIATSDGLTIPRPKFFVELQSQLKLLQRRASRKQKRSKNWEKTQIKVSRVNHKIANTRKDFHLKVAHQLCDQADSIFVEDIDFRVMAKGFLGKHSLDAGFGQFRDLLKWVCWKRGKFFSVVDHRRTSKQCPNCGSEWDNDLSIRWHTCSECGYSNNRDVASAEVICNRGIEKLALSRAEMYPRTIGERKLTARMRTIGGEILDKCNAGTLGCEVKKPTLTTASFSVGRSHIGWKVPKI